MKKIITLIICSVIVQFAPVFAQQTTVGYLSFASNAFGPMVGNSDTQIAYSRHAYIYPRNTLGDLRHGDTIRMIEFYKIGLGTYLGNPRFKMYVGLTDSADWGVGNIKNWSAEVAKTGMIKTFDSTTNHVISAEPGFKKFPMLKYLVYDTTKGKNLKIMVEFYQTAKQSVDDMPYWAYESGASFPGFVSNNETKFIYYIGNAPDTTNNSQVRKPCIRISHQRVAKSASVQNIYCLGELAISMTPTDSIKVLIANTGYAKLNNHPIELSITGANTFKDTIFVNNLAPLEERFIYFTHYRPKNLGKDSIQVMSLSDNYPLDDTSFNQRRITANVLSHNNPYVTNTPGGIGFNGSTGDFVAKFYTDTNYINQIKIGFASTALPFKLAVWNEDSTGGPGNLIYQSDTLYTNGSQYILPIFPKIKVTNGYYVGIRQLGNSNVAFLFEYEVPVRPSTFYFTAPSGNTDWVPFSPGFNYNFDIQPRIQLANDVGVWAIHNPIPNDTLELAIDSIIPAATIINYGVNDQKVPFKVVCEARNKSGSLIYQSIKYIQLDADDTLLVHFDKGISQTNYGNLELLVYTELAGDKATENDSLRSNFSIFINYDIQVESFFSPTEGQRVELGKKEFQPVVRMVNFGAKKQSNIKVTSRVRQGTKIAAEQTQTISLDGVGSLILAFDSVAIPFSGNVILEVFCWNHIDSFRINDTLRLNLQVIRSNDLAVKSIETPKNGSVYLRKATFKPYVFYRNEGLADQDSAKILCHIKNWKGEIIYSDAITTSIGKLSSKQALFKTFTCPDSAQTLLFTVYTKLKGDQDSTNDRMSSTFYIRSSTDLKLLKNLSPVVDSTYFVNSSIPLSAVVKNIGNSTINSGTFIYWQIRNENNTIIHFDSVAATKTLAFNENDTTFTALNFATTNIGKYGLLTYLKYTGDVEKSNDSLYSHFFVNHRHSIGIDSVFNPAKNRTFRLNLDTVKLNFSAKNIGIHSIESPVYADIKINKNGVEVYSYSDSFSNLAPTKVQLITGHYFIPKTTGLYEATFKISNSEDAFINDNEVVIPFYVTLDNDVAPVAFVYPQIDSNVVMNKTYQPKLEVQNIGSKKQDIDFSVTYEIFAGTSLVYSSNKSITLDSAEIKTLAFDSSFIPTSVGLYTMRAISRLATDQVVLNDTLVGQFNVLDKSSISPILAQKLHIYPNPSVGTIHISSEEYPINSVHISDVLGREVRFEPLYISEKFQTISVQNNSPKVYFVEIVFEQGSTIQKIIIE
ncbi:MAG: T9SS type A sorting domain-containing protein [Flavobacteriales bacterium]|nr:T9SS type A sorting domain-containing protein [Flavobacteriales bacterium]